MKVALVHDFLNQRGGAERTVAAMARLFPEAPIFTSLYDPGGTFEDFQGKDIRTSFLQRLPHTEKSFRMLLPLYPRAFRSFDLSAYDLVISSSTHWAHHVRPPSHARHIVYCYNPPRWLYQTDDYVTEGGPVPRWAAKPLTPVLRWLRGLDQQAAGRPHAYIGISRLVASRIAETYGRSAQVVYPPVDVERFTPKGPGRGGKGGGKGHYLVVSRLLPYKRVDLAVQVCSERGAPLMVVGDGPARADLEAMAGPSVRFLGRVSDEDLLALYASARALIHCGQEDFGLTPLEANAAGIPCVALRNGGALETVIDGETGILISEQRGGELSKALDVIERQVWDPAALRRHASAFDESNFHLNLLRAIDRTLADAGGAG